MFFKGKHEGIHTGRNVRSFQRNEDRQSGSVVVGLQYLSLVLDQHVEQQRAWRPGAIIVHLAHSSKEASKEAGQLKHQLDLEPHRSDAGPGHMRPEKLRLGSRSLKVKIQTQIQTSLLV